MSVLIKGMEMPPNCFLCPLSVLNGERLFCEVTKDEVIRSRIPSDCPLAELPPHGRLIDAERIKLAIAITLERLTSHPWMSGKEIMLKTAFKTLALMVDDAPTVIEAEETE